MSRSEKRVACDAFSFFPDAWWDSTFVRRLPVFRISVIFHYVVCNKFTLGTRLELSVANLQVSETFRDDLEFTL